MRYLVTGGAGFIGSALVKRLLADGHEVTALDDMSRGRPQRLHGLRAGIRVVRCDVRDQETVAWAMRDCDAVVHAAYCQGTQTFYEEPRRVLDVALRGMLSVLAACEQTGCRELLLVSSSEAYQVAAEVPAPETVACSVPDPLNPRYSYGGGKIACEIMAAAWQRAGVLDRVVIARPHNVYGPDMGREHVIPEFCLRMNALVREHPEVSVILPFPIQGSGQETRSFCYISDCVDQLALLLKQAEQGASIYHVGTMDERTVADVAFAIAGCYRRVIAMMPGKLPAGSPPRRLPDTAKVERLGYRPQVAFEQGLAETVRWYQAHG